MENWNDRVTNIPVFQHFIHPSLFLSAAFLPTGRQVRLCGEIPILDKDGRNYFFLGGGAFVANSMT
jgi:hypothetical protein